MISSVIIYMEDKDLEKLVLQGLEYEEIEKKKASERKALTRKNGIKVEEAKYIDGTKGQTRDIVASKLGISGKHWERMKFIYLNKENISQDDYYGWKIGKLSTLNVYNKLCRDVKTTEKINEVLSIIDDMQKKLIAFKKSYTLIDVNNNIDNLLWNYPKLKEPVKKCFDAIKNERQEYSDSHIKELLNLEEQVRELKKKIK